MLVLTSLFTMTLSVPQVQADITVGTLDPETSTVEKIDIPN